MTQGQENVAHSAMQHYFPHPQTRHNFAGRNKKDNSHFDVDIRGKTYAKSKSNTSSAARSRNLRPPMFTQVSTHVELAEACEKREHDSIENFRNTRVSGDLVPQRKVSSQHASRSISTIASLSTARARDAASVVPTRFSNWVWKSDTNFDVISGVFAMSRFLLSSTYTKKRHISPPACDTDID